ncbi:hypothetical protein Tcan_09467 [Toxocara canis]|uniref:BHLH domain-containing protein n=1 Tax=Toxocara canis TaxID=6265 RepID=A0A0B2VE75_TOXCA|nr:hypothetical protein Tcan_09467 [Toxocara canis]
MRSSPSPSSCYSSSSESDPSSIVRKGRITKASREKRERRETMAKLQKMVPYAREGDSQLQLLQHIMDYIYFLQLHRARRFPCSRFPTGARPSQLPDEAWLACAMGGALPLLQ